jgi:hypothetical protein
MNPRIGNPETSIRPQTIENKMRRNGPSIAINRVPVMYRLLERFPADPRTAGFD